MNDALLKKLARTYLADAGDVYISKELAADIRTLAKRLREGGTVTLAEIDLVLAELETVPGYAEAESKAMLESVI
jgi:hypothetical protein